uniref:Cytochrome c oxidase assembly factor 7 homolog n=2 Tax=Cacopsylla melanoneura TaxID=428564 RepID=A0A8D8WP42_9HEMI
MLATSPLIINLIVVKFSVTLKRQAVPNPEMNSGDEKETKEYIKNLGIEYRFGCYSEKNPEACHLLGDYLDAIQKDMEKAMKVYKANCDDAAYPRSCFQYGRLLMRDKNITEQEKLDVAPSYFEKGCEGNHPESCVMNGIGQLIKAAGNQDTTLYAKER